MLNVNRNWVTETVEYLKDHKQAVFITLFSLLGLILALYLVQKQQIFKSKAFAPEEILQIESAGQTLTYDTEREGYVTTSNTIKIKLQIPEEPREQKVDPVLPEPKSNSASATQTSTFSLNKQPDGTVSIKHLFGVSSHVWWIDSNPQLYINHFKNLGVTDIRLAVDWRRFEKVEGKYDFSMYDRVLPTLSREGFEITGVFVTVPAWASSNPTGCGNEPTQTDYCDLPDFRMPQFRNAVRETVMRYPFITRWEVGNEPEQWKHLGDELKDYLPTLKIFYEEAKNVNPNIQVAAATIRGWDDYVSGMYALDPKKHWDAITFHPYPCESVDCKNKTNISAADDSGTELRTKEIDKIRAGMVAKGDGHKPIWITEYGWNRSPQEQAKHFNASIKWLSTRPWVTVAHIHMLHDAYDVGSPQQYGLTYLEPFKPEITSKTNLKPKPYFYDAFKNHPRSITQF